MTNQKPLCPECGTKMAKAGFAWSGRNKVQRWRCHKCGKTKIKGAYQTIKEG